MTALSQGTSLNHHRTTTDTLASGVPGALPAEISTSTEGRQKPLKNYPNTEKIIYKSPCTFS